MTPRDRGVRTVGMLIVGCGVALGAATGLSESIDEWFMFGANGLEQPARAVGIIDGTPTTITVRLEDYPLDQFTRTPFVPSSPERASASSAVGSVMGSSASPPVTMQAFHQPYDVAFWVARSENESYGWLECGRPQVYGTRLGLGALVEVWCDQSNMHEVRGGSLLVDWVADTTGTTARPIVIPFETNSAELSDNALGLLDDVLAGLRRAPQLEVVIGGLAEAGEADAVTLAQRRADAVRSAMAGKGISSERLAVITYGSTLTPMVERISEGIAKRLVVITRLARTKTPS